MKRRHVIYLLLMTLAVAACHQQKTDLGSRAVVDNLNREAFLNRYDDPEASIAAAYSALQYISDTLPLYADGKLRAWNCLATAYYVASVADSAQKYVDSVCAAKLAGKARNRKVEEMIAHLIEARLLQRQCDIAGSYEILYNIEKSHMLPLGKDNLLYNYAQSEYYITALTLNYHYRDGMEQNVGQLLGEAEGQRERLKCDYAQDMALNYAMAYGYSSLCSREERQSENLTKALGYCLENLALMADESRFSLFHYANTLQMLALISTNSAIGDSVWQSEDVSALTAEAIALIGERQMLDDVEELIESDSSHLPSLALYVKAAYLFEEYGDPYQTLGAFVATGRRLLAIGDTAAARTWFLQAYEGYKMPLYSAPKSEARLYEGLIMTDTVAVATRSRILHDLISYIHHNEQADFATQTRLAVSERRVTTYRVLAGIGTFVFLILVGLLIALSYQTRVLHREKRALQQAKQRDLQRTSAVETCLSVMRHDIGPFIAYLQNPSLPPEIHQEVLGQLLRTFENIKNWTNLSIPEGLPFHATECDLQAVMEHSLPLNPRPGSLTLKVEECHLKAYADQGLLTILLHNLVTNAIRYTPQGSITLAAREYSADNRFVELTVSDSGCGMDEEKIDTLFRSDRAPQQSENGEHYGFGLILCRYIVKKHDDNTLRGCRIWAESTPLPSPDHGTTFHIIIAQAPLKQ